MPFLTLFAILFLSLPVAAQITLTPSGVFSARGLAASEIPAYDPITKRSIQRQRSQLSSRCDQYQQSSSAYAGLYNYRGWLAK